MRYITFVVVILTLILSSCKTGGCISIGGGYKGIEGSVEYCFDNAKSKDAGRPVLVNKDGEKLTGLEDGDIKDLVDLIKEKGKELIGMKAVESKAPVAENKDPAKELFSLLKKYREDKKDG